MPRASRRHPTRVNRERGSAYVLALCVILIACAVGMGMAGLAVATRVVVLNADQMDAAFARADAGLEFALWYTALDEQWRGHITGPVSVPWAWSDGQVTVEFRDPDGDLSDDPDDPVEIFSTAAFGDTRRTLEVQAEPVPMRILRTALHSNLSMTIEGTVTASAPVSSNASIIVRGTLDGDAEAALAVVNLGTITGTVTQGVPIKQMPDSNFVASHVADATPISIYSIPAKKIEYVVLSPGNNPYGATNPEGIYLIQCHGEKLEIKRCRIVGTLIIDSCKSDSEIKEDVLWEPANGDRPALIVWNSSRINIKLDRALNEADRGVNFNPAHTPYQGEWDEELADVYESQIAGLVYATGDIVFDRSMNKVVGTVLAGGGITINGGDNLEVTYDPQLAADPPAGGLLGPALRLIPGSYRRIITPPDWVLGDPIPVP